VQRVPLMSAIAPAVAGAARLAAPIIGRRPTTTRATEGLKQGGVSRFRRKPDFFSEMGRA